MADQQNSGGGGLIPGHGLSAQPTPTPDAGGDPTRGPSVLSTGPVVSAGQTSDLVAQSYRAAVAGKTGDAFMEADRNFWNHPEVKAHFENGGHEDGGATESEEGAEGAPNTTEATGYTYQPGDGVPFEQAIDQDPAFAERVKAMDAHLGKVFEGRISAAWLHSLDGPMRDAVSKGHEAIALGLDVPREPGPVVTAVYSGDQAKFDAGLSLITEAIESLYGDRADEIIDEIGNTGAIYDPKFHENALFLAMTALGKRI